MIRLTETTFRTHRPTWEDIIQLLVSVFSTEGRHRIVTEARKWFREMAPEDTANPQQWEELAAPTRGPTGTVTQRKRGASWRDSGRVILQGLVRGARKPMTMAEPSEVIQRESESPSEFCERLCEAYRLYTPIDPARGCWVSDGDKCSLYVSSLSRKCQMKGHQVTHEFLYIPKCPVPLLGRDLLSKFGAQVTFPPTKDPLFEWAQPPICSPSR